MAQFIGGSFAPPLSDEALVRYRELAEALEPSPHRDAMLACCKCCQHWWDLPESDVAGRAHPLRGMIVDLTPELKAALYDDIPWDHELDAYSKLFEEFHPVTQKELRDAAHHLLWHVRELNKDREPLTTDKL